MMDVPMRAAAVALTLLLTGCSVDAARTSGASPVRAAASGPSTPAGIGPEPTAPQAPASWAIDRVDADLRARLRGRTWHPGCPVPLRDLRVLTVRYVGFDGRRHVGPLVLHERVTEDVRWVFRRLLRDGFPIKRIALAPRWRPPRPRDWFDTRDITASFNCRPVTGGTSFSQHSYGWAVDINPLQNPYVDEDGVRRRAAKAYVDRTQDLPGMIHAGDVVVRSFARIGWSWGGDWTSLKDPMHFSLTGR